MKIYLTIASILMFLIALKSLINRIMVLFNGTRFDGLFQDIEKRKTVHNNQVRNRTTAIIEYVDQDNMSHTIEDDFVTWVAKKGDQISIICDPRNPKRVYIGNLIILFIPPILMLLLALGAHFAKIKNF